MYTIITPSDAHQGLGAFQMGITIKLDIVCFFMVSVQQANPLSNKYVHNNSNTMTPQVKCMRHYTAE